MSWMKFVGPVIFGLQPSGQVPGNWVVNQDDPVYYLVKQCNDCAEIWPYEQIWHTCVDEDKETCEVYVLSRYTAHRRLEC